MMADEEPRSLQQVIPVCDRVRCTNWMELDKAPHGSKGLYGRAVDFFPALFRSSDRRVNMNKARDWWSKQEHGGQAGRTQSAQVLYRKSASQAPDCRQGARWKG
ncbi:hypothetical protein PF002_g1234 [Phytophthora fragariae]|uniref:Uncharacterized protein n=1 Tax=Phytophthora fragariae TaxID=53985 RepID=A0A6A3USP8_9STRA|nr:hypothetical protein PF006_g1120 [Phytophthora fragariae]KAE9257218.1 hypothetical protein PF002_g1234 [Phytophthora fragariae]